MPDLAALEILVAVASTKSLSGAGREVGMTQQAVSARISSLEAQAGVRLVVRTTRGSKLTAAGVVAVQWADRLLRVAQEVDAGLSALRESSRSRIRVSASLTVAEHLLPSWLVSLQTSQERLSADHPEVVLTATNSDHVIEQLRAEEADLGFIEGPRVPSGLRSRVVAHDELMLVVRPDHPWARRRAPITATELARTPLVSRERGSGTRESLHSALMAALGAHSEVAQPALELSTAASVRAAVLAGSAPAVMSPLLVGDDITAGRLHAVPVVKVDLRRDLRAVWVGGRTPPAGAVRDLLTHIASITRM